MRRIDTFGGPQRDQFIAECICAQRCQIGDLGTLSRRSDGAVGSVATKSARIDSGFRFVEFSHGLAKAQDVDGRIHQLSRAIRHERRSSGLDGPTVTALNRLFVKQGASDAQGKSARIKIARHIFNADATSWDQRNIGKHITH